MGRKIGYLALSLALVGFVAVTSVESTNISQNYNAALNLGPDQSVPAEATPMADCDIARDNCGSITPSSVSVFVADGANNTTEGTLFFVDVPSGNDGVFQVDPATCSIVSGTYYSVNAGLSQRGIGYDADNHEIYHGGWNYGDRTITQSSATPPYAYISSLYTGLGIASMAVDAAGDILYVATNSYPDYVYAYDISAGIGSVLAAWTVPWQCSTDGYDMAGIGPL